MGWFDSKKYMVIRLDRRLFGPKSGNKTSAPYIEKFPTFGPEKTRNDIYTQKTSTTLTMIQETSDDGSTSNEENKDE